MTEERIPPQKIRVTKLQEAQLLDLAAIEARCAQMFYELGYTDADVPVRGENDIARLTRGHDILVAEADHQVAGFLVWADQAPGVAWVATLQVSPLFQRFGVGTRLLRDLGEMTQNHGIEYVCAPVWDRAAFSQAFLGAMGFSALGDHPKKLDSWRELNPDLAREGQTILWSETDGLGTIPGIPRPSERPPSA